MGICFSHGDANWSYSGFMDFRQQVVSSIDPELDVFEVFHGVSLSDEPIHPFLMHSDCDGELSVEELKQILPQLKYIVTGWNEVDDEDSFYNYNIYAGLELIKGMEEAVSKNEPLIFH